MQPYPRSLDLICPGHLHGTGCLSALVLDTGFPTVVWRLCLGLGFAVTPPHLAVVSGGCAWVWCVRLDFGVGLRPAIAGWGFGAHVVVCALRLTPPLLAGVCGVGVCAWALSSVAPRQSWLGCLGACVFVCVPRLYPATPGSGVRSGCLCLCSGCGCAPPLLAGVLGSVCVCVRPSRVLPLLAGVCGVRVCVRARVSAVPRHSRLGCWGVCVFVCALGLCPATFGWGVRRVCVCLGSGFCWAPPLLLGV